MLQIKNITKQYVTGELVQDALNDVSLNFRKNEFVAVLGPSGSGKTTLLNIIGGLDRYDSGDLIINGISTKQYQDRDWDSYRNHTIGFVFQSYNLIPHQSILANVELALTISGVTKKERRQRAQTALEEVGLGDQGHKRPDQMSGGQMQRVAIARALVNNPDILLADEPTGSLDTETSIQVMELLKVVAQDRLVVMVTHNPELADRYATRIVKLRDGQVIDDSDPYYLDRTGQREPRHENMGKASMSFLTSLALSFNNLRTKKARTLLTAFAGSIGIIGIALILSLSNGVNTYIDNIQRETMASYPITINAYTFDFTSMMGGPPAHVSWDEIDHDLDAVYADNTGLEMVNLFTTSLAENNLTDFKQYLDDPESEVQQYLGANGIVYSYDVPFGVYTRNSDGRLIDANNNALLTPQPQEAPGAFGNVQRSMMGNMNVMMGSSGGNSMYSQVFAEILPGTDGQLISDVILDSYELVYGEWPSNYDEVVLVLNSRNELPTTTLYALGLISSRDYDGLVTAIETGHEVEVKDYSFSYEEISDRQFSLLTASDYYLPNEKGLFDYIGDDSYALEAAVEDGIVLKIAGIVRSQSSAINAAITGSIGYTNALTNYIIEAANNSEVLTAQRNNPQINVLNGMHFNPVDDETKIMDARDYLLGLEASEKARLTSEIATMAFASNPMQLQAMYSLGEANLAIMVDQYLQNADDEMYLTFYDSYIATGSFEENMTAFGFVSLEAPSAINIYADTFEAKDAIAQSISRYNETVSEENQIVYTDFVAMMTSSITTIINVISYVLIAFVAVSLIVSSIMIGIITYISVLERTKEIGILRAIGASKQNISEVFNAETFIIGLLSGLLGVGVSRLLLIPGNAIIHSVTGSPDVNAILPIPAAVILVILSVVLTLIGGLIPSKQAASKDPVLALRSE